MRTFIAGLIIGVVIAMGLPVSASDAPAAPPVEESAPIKLVVNGQEITLPDAQPRIVDGQVMVPVVAFSEVAGFTVEWDEETKTLHVTTTVAPEPEEAKKAPSGQAYPLTVTENGVTYYEMETLRDLLKTKYPGETIGLGVEDIRVGSKYYSAVTKVIGNRGYVDVRSLLNAEVLKTEDLAQYYAK